MPKLTKRLIDGARTQVFEKRTVLWDTETMGFGFLCLPSGAASYVFDYRNANGQRCRFFDACGNPHLAEAIHQFALKVYIVRSLTISDPKLLKRAVEEHAEIIAYLKAGDRANLVRMVVDHILPSRDAYLEAYRRRFG